MSISLDDLIEKLEELREEFGGDAEVRLAHQPRWAFEYSIDADAIAGVTFGSDRRGDKRSCVYIGEGSQVGYLPGAASVAIGWSEAKDEEVEEGDDDDRADGEA